MPRIIGTPNGDVNRQAEWPPNYRNGVQYDGGKITLLRSKKGWSMAELARRARISQPSLWALEHQVTKKPKADTLLAIATALQVPLRDIMRRSTKAEAVNLAEDLSELFDRLDGRNKNALLAAARALLDSQK